MSEVCITNREPKTRGERVGKKEESPRRVQKTGMKGGNRQLQRPEKKKLKIKT